MIKVNLKSSDQELILEALEAYKDTDNEEYNGDINALINKQQNSK